MPKAAVFKPGQYRCLFCGEGSGVDQKLGDAGGCAPVVCRFDRCRHVRCDAWYG